MGPNQLTSNLADIIQLITPAWTRFDFFLLAGTFVMQIEGKDRDQDGTINSNISYSIISQEPEGTGHMFIIDKVTGKLYVNEPTLDREVRLQGTVDPLLSAQCQMTIRNLSFLSQKFDFYKLVVKGTDMGGAEGGLTGTGTVEIRVLDINDNIPTLTQSEVRQLERTQKHRPRCRPRSKPELVYFEKCKYDAAITTDTKLLHHQASVCTLTCLSK